MPRRSVYLDSGLGVAHCRCQVVLWSSYSNWWPTPRIERDTTDTSIPSAARRAVAIVNCSQLSLACSLLQFGRSILIDSLVIQIFFLKSSRNAPSQYHIYIYSRNKFQPNGRDVHADRGEIYPHMQGSMAV